MKNGKIEVVGGIGGIYLPNGYIIVEDSQAQGVEGVDHLTFNIDLIESQGELTKIDYHVERD